MSSHQWNAVGSTHPQTQSVHQTLNHKYDTQFNFFLTKTTNELIYSHTLSPNFIEFKDQIIFADNNQYLKRYYFLKNANDKDQIFDRINLLAQFYGNAILLRHQYPLMVLTRTKSIFLKRLKRMKKYLVEQGSSDESHSEINEQAVSINSSRFLKTLSSCELQQKSIDESNHLQLDFSLFKEEELQFHDAYNPLLQNQQIQNSLLLSNITKFTRELACQLNIEREQNEDELAHLTVDFEQQDRQDIIRRYHKIIQKENRSANNSKTSMSKKEISLRSSQYMPMHQKQIKELMEKKPMTSSITITALEDHHMAYGQQYHSPNQKNMGKKSMLSPKFSDRREGQINSKSPIKRSTFYQYELEHKYPFSNKFVIAEDDLEESPKNIKNQDKIPSFYRRQEPQFTNRGYTSRQRLPQQTKRNLQKVKLSSILTHQKRYPRSSTLTDNDNTDRIKPLSHRDPEYKDHFTKDQYPTYDRYANPDHNRMTSINININNHDEKKQDHRVNVKVHKNKFTGEQLLEQDRLYRVQKKRKIRQKAAALLNRVKSQDYMRPIRQPQSYEYQQNPGYFDRYYR